MIVTEGVVEAPVLAALFKVAPSPRYEDVLTVLRDRDVQDAAIEVAERMRRLAREADDEILTLRNGGSPMNYRRFYVGAVGIGLTLGRRSTTPYEWWTFAAVNTKPSKKATKYCAEMRIVRAAKEVHCSCIGGLVVVGESQPDGRSGELRKTLDPCEACRDMMRAQENRHLFREKTLVVTSRPLSQVRYVESLPTMMAAHREKW